MRVDNNMLPNATDYLIANKLQRKLTFFNNNFPYTFIIIFDIPKKTDNSVENYHFIRRKTSRCLHQR